MGRLSESSFDGNEAHPTLSVRYVFLYVLACVRKMNIWSVVECKAIAYDITMDTIMELFIEEKSGLEVHNRYEYVINGVRSLLKQQAFVFYIKTRRFPTSGESPSSVDDFCKIFTNSESIDSTNPDELSMMNLFNNEEQTFVLLKNSGFDSDEIANKMDISSSDIGRILGAVRTKLYRRYNNQ
ncbi:hypothetical protein GCM10028808_40020 [Spirosoma migulaei]